MCADFGTQILVHRSTRGCCIPTTCFLDKALRECSFLPVGVNPSSSGVSGRGANVVQPLVTSCFSSVAFCSRFHRVVKDLAQ